MTIAPEVRETVLAAIVAAAVAYPEFEAADVRHIVGQFTDCRVTHPNHWGCLFQEARALGWIERVAVEPTRSPSRNGGLNGVWVGTPALVALRLGLT